MNMKKKAACAVAAALVLVMCLSGCGGEAAQEENPHLKNYIAAGDFPTLSPDEEAKLNNSEENIERVAEFLSEADSIYGSAGYTCYEEFGDDAVVIVPVVADSFNRLSRGLELLASIDLSQYEPTEELAQDAAAVYPFWIGKAGETCELALGMEYAPDRDGYVDGYKETSVWLTFTFADGETVSLKGPNDGLAYQAYGLITVSKVGGIADFMDGVIDGYVYFTDIADEASERALLPVINRRGHYFFTNVLYNTIKYCGETERESGDRFTIKLEVTGGDTYYFDPDTWRFYIAGYEDAVYAVPGESFEELAALLFGGWIEVDE